MAYPNKLEEAITKVGGGHNGRGISGKVFKDE